ncbi:hypothetical protein Vretifemale_2627 [Volvox reticuliferus]|nr:hypothetical protein Vretifemale_2627 [Volvox reticuliferus]
MPSARQPNRHPSVGICRQHHMYQLGPMRDGVLSTVCSRTLSGGGVGLGTSQGASHHGSGSTNTPSLPPQQAPGFPQSKHPAAAAGLQPTYSCRVPGVASCPLLDKLENAQNGGNGARSSSDFDKEYGGRRHSIYASSSESSDDEAPMWGPQFNPEFEGVMEDEDAFLRLLHEATAPHVPPNAPAAARRPPPPMAPPGGIRPSPSVVDMLLIPATGPSSATASHGEWKTKKSQHSHNHPRQAAVRGAKPQGTVVVTMAGPGAGPMAAQSGGGLSGGAVAWAPVSAIRPLLARAKACAAAAALEPPWLGSGPADLAAWSRVLAGCEGLVNSVGALECLLDDRQLVQPQGGQRLGASSMLTMLGADIVAPYRRVYGEVAASCAAMSIAVAASCEGGSPRADAKQAPGSPGQLFAAVGGWEESKQHLRNLVRDSLSAYWARVRGLGGPISGGTTGLLSLPLHQRYHLQRFQRARRGGRIPIMGLHQSRALNFLWTVTEGILSAMNEMEAAVRELLRVKHELAASRVPAPDGATDSAAACVQIADAERANEGIPEGSVSSQGTSRRDRGDSSNSSSGGGGRVGGRGGRGPGSGDVAEVPSHASARLDVGPGFSCPAPTVAMFHVAVSSSPSGAHPRSRPAASSITIGMRVQQTCSALGRLWRLQRDNWDWAWRVVQLALGIPLLLNTVSIIATNTKLLLGAAGADGRRALLSSRRFHFGAKYWAASSFMLCLLLGLAARPDVELLRRYSLMYAFLATSVSMTDRVESTFSRVALRAGGTLLGGALGLAVMMTPALNHSPAAILVIVCAATFLAAYRLIVWSMARFWRSSRFTPCCYAATAPRVAAQDWRLESSSPRGWCPCCWGPPCRCWSRRLCCHGSHPIGHLRRWRLPLWRLRIWCDSCIDITSKSK